MLAVLVVLGGSLSALAKPPVRVNVLGVVYGSGASSQSWTQVQVSPVTNNVFGLTASPTLELVTQIAFYFRIETDSFSSFSLSLKKLSTSLQDNTSVTLNNVDIACYSGIGPNVGYYSLQNKTQTSRTVNADGTTDYNWTFVSQSGAITGKPYLKVIVPFQNFMISTTPFYFETVSFYVDGESAVLSYSEQQLTGINSAINEDVPLPSAVPSLEEIGGEIVNEGLNLAQSWMQYFTTNFDIAGAMGRVVKPFSDFFLEIPSDGNPAHTTLVIISLFSLGAVIVVWLINKLKRRQDDA